MVESNADDFQTRQQLAKVPEKVKETPETAEHVNEMMYPKAFRKTCAPGFDLLMFI